MSAPSTERRAERYLVLSLGTTQVLLEPAQVRDIEAAEQVNTTDAPPGARGTITLASHAVPVYDLSANFDLCTDAPLADRFCVWLADPTISMAVLCDKVDMLEVSETLHPLPACMRLAHSPVGSLALRSEGLLCQSSAARLIASVQQMAQAFEPATANGVAP